MFKVRVDVARGVFETAVIGFWDLHDVEAFGQAITAAARRVQAATGRPPVSICDYTAAETQSQDVAAALTALMRRPAVRSARVAMIVGGPLARLQAKRIVAERPEIRFFDRPDDARAWVHWDEAPTRRAA